MSQPTYQWKVVMSVPIVDANSNYNATATVNNVNTLINDWNSLAPANLQLVGFYWPFEFVEPGNCKAAIQSTAATVHSNALTFWWNPFHGQSVPDWSTYGFDYVTLQPNYAFNSQDWLRSWWFTQANTDMTSNGLAGPEIEFGPTNGLDEVQNADDYFHYAEQYQWNDKLLNLYYYAPDISSFASDPTERIIYDDLYRYMTPSLRAQWHFAEGTGSTTSDSSSYTNNGTISGATWSSGLGGTQTPASGLSGSALSFNGVNNYVSVPDNSSLDVTGNLTLEAWIKPTSVPQSYAAIVGRNVSGQRMLLGSDGSIRVEMGTIQQTAAGVVNFNTWNHVVYTSDGTTSDIYVNGVLVSTGAGGANFSSTAAVRIGRSGSSYPFKGLIDDVRIYSRVLSPEEIERNYDTGLRDAELALSLEFDETANAESRVYDSTQYELAADDNGVVGEYGEIYGAVRTDTGIEALGNALSFDGSSSYVSYPDRPHLDVTGNLTLEAWIQPTSVPQSYAAIVGRDASGQRMLLGSDGSIRVEMGTTQQTAAGVVDLNTWNDVVYTSNGTTSYIYVNGLLVSTGSGGANFSSTGALLIGQSHGRQLSLRGHDRQREDLLEGVDFHRDRCELRRCNAAHGDGRAGGIERLEQRLPQLAGRGGLCDPGRPQPTAPPAGQQSERGHH